jgi:hypothetical protein
MVSLPFFADSAALFAATTLFGSKIGSMGVGGPLRHDAHRQICAQPRYASLFIAFAITS